MQKPVKTEQEKEAIVAEYLSGDISYRGIKAKYGVSPSTVYLWVSKFQGKLLRKPKPKPEAKTNTAEPLPTDIKVLQEELRKAKLHNELLNAMIDIAEDQLKIDIRKKSGARQ